MVRWLVGLALLLIALPALAHSPHSYDRDGHTIQVVADGPNDLKITVDGAEWTYSASGNSSAIMGPISTSSAQAGLVSSVVDQYKADHAASTRGGSGFNLFVGIIVAVAGIVGLVKPELIWYLKSGWMFRDAEPSDLALTLHRIGGGVALVIGIGLFISGLW